MKMTRHSSYCPSVTKLRHILNLKPIALIRFKIKLENLLELSMPSTFSDAEDAVHGRDGYNYDGYTLRVEFPKDSNRGSRSLYRGRGGGGSYRGGGRRGGRGGGIRRPENRVLVSNLPPSGSWQDLKDHMREAGDICFADVYKDGTGIVEFLHHDDMKYAIRKLDDTKFRSHENETAYIRVKEDAGRRDRSRSRSRSQSCEKRDRRSPSYSPMRRSRSLSPGR